MGKNKLTRSLCITLNGLHEYIYEHLIQLEAFFFKQHIAINIDDHAKHLNLLKWNEGLYGTRRSFN